MHSLSLTQLTRSLCGEKKPRGSLKKTTSGSYEAAVGRVGVSCGGRADVMAKRKAETSSPAEESDLLTIRPLYVSHTRTHTHTHTHTHAHTHTRTHTHTHTTHTHDTHTQWSWAGGRQVLYHAGVQNYCMKTLMSHKLLL